MKGGESSEFPSAYLLAWQNLCRLGPDPMAGPLASLESSSWELPLWAQMSLQGRLVLRAGGAAKGSGLCCSHLGTHPRLARALVPSTGLARPVAGYVAQASHFPCLGTTFRSERQLSLVRECEGQVAALC